eukprot:TRINITY_DN2646_c0_g2_i1.p1 TRINITY_DN2646_c0_g2~~TRINITY_DN2646_c0_g2_i1.p1  ORF type:complete len:203 (-),score=15.33 TRINITY_DN2646_c0_g2_i1:869-1477(-)
MDSNKPSQQGGTSGRSLGEVRLVTPAVHASGTAVSITKLSLVGWTPSPLQSTQGLPAAQHPPEWEARLLTVSAAELSAIKSAATAALPQSTQWISAMDALSAYLWSAVMRATHSAGLLPPDCCAPGAVSRYRFTVDIRRRVDPPLPLPFAGNAVIIIAAEAPMAQVLDPSPSALAATAAAVRAAIEAVDAQRCGAQLAWLAA